MSSQGQGRGHSFFRVLIAGVLLSYAGAILAFLAARALLTTWPGWLAFLNHFSPFLFAPLPLMFPLLVWSRSRAGLVGVVAASLTFIALYGELFLPRLRPVMSQPSSPLIKVMTYNLEYTHPWPEEVVATVSRQDADIVAVQEVTHRVAKLMRDTLSDQYPYMYLDPERRPNDFFDNGLLSKYPIIGQELFDPAEIGWKAMHVIVDIEGTPVHLFNVHPRTPRLFWRREGDFLYLFQGFSDEAAERQLLEIATYVEALSEPVLVMGDFNSTDQGRGYRRLRRTLRDAFREAGWGMGFTFPNRSHVGRLPIPGPMVRIDFILHSDHFDTLNARVGRDVTTDHFYVTADLIFRNNPSRRSS